MSEIDDLKIDILKAVEKGDINKKLAAKILKQVNQSGDVAIIGIACKLPGANTPAEFWENIKNKKIDIKTFPEKRLKTLEGFYDSSISVGRDSAKMGYLDEIDKFDATFFNISSTEALKMEPAQRLFLQTAYSAIEDAGYGGDAIYGTRTAVYIGIDSTDKSQYMQLLKSSDLLALTGSTTGILSGRISYILNLHGPSVVVDTVCSGGLVAVHQACKALKNSECSMAIAGGINIFTFFQHEYGIREVESGNGEIRSFDKNAKGTVWGEGVGALLLKPLSRAIADKDSIYAVIKGSAINNTGASNGITSPSPDAEADAIIRAWKDANINPETLSYIETHATGTIIGDPIEIEGLTNAFRAFTTKKQFCAIGSVKPNIGHTVATSGIASVIKVILALKHGEIPPSINFTEPNPFINFCDSPVYVHDKLTKWNQIGMPRRAGVSSFGFSGTNCHIVLEEAPKIECAEKSNQKTEDILTLSAKNKESLKELVKSYISFLEENPTACVANICFTQNSGRGHYDYRLAIIHHDIETLKRELIRLSDEGFKSSKENGVYYAKHSIIPDFKEKVKVEQIYQKEKNKLDKMAQVIIKEFIASGDNDLELCDKICRCYVYGAEIEWNEIYKNRKLQRLNLPVYPFQSTSFWPKVNATEQESMFYHIQWVESTVPDDQTITGTVILFKDQNDDWRSIKDSLQANGTSVIEVEIGDHYQSISEKSYLIRNCEEDYEALLKENDKIDLTHIIHMSTLGVKANIDDLDQLESVQEKGIYCLFFLRNALISCNLWEQVELVLVSKYSCEVLGDEKHICPNNETFLSLGNVIRQEHLACRCRCIDIDDDTNIECIITEMKTAYSGLRIAYRSTRRYEEHLNELLMDQQCMKEVKIKSEGIYIISGGVGGIGLEVSNYLVKKNSLVKLALICRSRFPARDRWDEILLQKNDERLSSKINKVRDLEAKGATIELISADIANEKEMSEIITALRDKYGRINGVIHSAGISGSGPISTMTKSEFGEVLMPKIQGTFVLDKLISKDDLDFFVLFSSSASILGFPEQGGYAVANSYLDSFSQERTRQGKRTITINWASWAEVGMAVDHGVNSDGVFKAMPTKEAINAFDTVLKTDLTRIIVGKFNYNNSILYKNYPFSFKLSQKISDRMEAATSRNNDESKPHHDVIVAGKENNSYSELEKKLAEIWADVLGIKEIDVYENFYDMGGNSILAGTLMNAMEEAFEGVYSVIDIYSYPTVVQMSEYISSKLQKTTKKGETKDIEVTREKKDIAIIGMACRFSEADSTDEFWNNLRNGKNSIREFPINRWKDVKAYYGNQETPGASSYRLGYLDEIDKFDATFFKISPKEAKFMDPIQRLFMEVSYESVEDAGYGGNRLNSTRTGVYLGTDCANMYQYQSTLKNQGDTLAVTGSSTSILASRIAYYLNLHGPCITVDTACSSSLVAVHQACYALRNDECNMAIAGGVNLNLLPQIRAGIREVENINGEIRTFDRKASGTAWGEGAGAVLLKPLDDAIRDKDNILAVIKGSSVNCDGASNGLTAPNPEAQTDVIERAWKDAQINPETLSYIESHGTGTVLGDPIEIKGLTNAFRKYTDKKQFCGIGSVKTNIGHTAAASGIASLIKVILALQYGEIPASLNFREPNQYINFIASPIFINDTIKSWKRTSELRRAGVSSFGFSGTNCHVVLEEAPVVNASPADDENITKTLTLSAKSIRSLKMLIHKYQTFITIERDLNLSDLCYTANTGRGHHNYRLAIMIRTKEDLNHKLTKLFNEFDLLDSSQITTEKDIYYGNCNLETKNSKSGGDYERREKNSKAAKQIIMEYKSDAVVEKLSRLCELYVSGTDIDWNELYSMEKRKKVRLPVYPFDHKRYWNEAIADNIAPENVSYTMEWKPKAVVSEDYTLNGTVIIIDNHKKIGETIGQKLEMAGKAVIYVQIGPDYKKLDSSRYVVSGEMDDYAELLRNIKETQHLQILHLQTMNDTQEVNNVEELAEKQNGGVLGLFQLSQALIKSEIKAKIDIILVSQYIHEVIGTEKTINPTYATMFGFGKVIAQENRRFRCKAVDLDDLAGADEIILEMSTAYKNYNIAYRNGQRFVEQLIKAPIQSNPHKVSLKEDGVYILTGGTGGIGLQLCKYLATQGSIHLALIGRSIFPERREWKTIVASTQKEALKKKIETLMELEEKGCEITVYSADISNMDEMNNTLQMIRKRYGTIHGIIHLAAISSDGFIKNRTKKEFVNVLKPKVMGTWILNKLTEDDKLDFFIMFSSIASILGGSGQGDYVAANAYMDSFSTYLGRKGRKSLAVNWPAWKEAGMALKNISQFDTIVKAITNDTGTMLFAHALTTSFKNLIYMELNLSQDTSQILDNLPFEVSNQIVTTIHSGINQEDETLDTSTQNFQVTVKSDSNDESISETEETVGAIWGKLLEMDEINIHDNFFQLGGNSLLSIQFELEMEQRNIPVEYVDIEKYPTVSRMASYIDTLNSEEKVELPPKQESMQLNTQVVEETESKDEHVLPQMEPFQDILYKDCFYSSLFSALQFYKININYILANDIIVYDGNNQGAEDIGFSVQYRAVKDINEIISDVGLKIVTSSNRNHVIEDCITSIQKDVPVIVWIDCYYSSIRKDTFHKKHWPHSLLVYGYNGENRTFNIIEHNHIGDTIYKKRIIPAQDLQDAYESYSDRYRNTTNYTPYTEIVIEDHIKLENAILHEQKTLIDTYTRNTLDHKKLIKAGIEYLKQFSSRYQELTKDEEALQKNANRILESLNNVINCKKVERYRIITLFKEDTQILSIMDEILEKWQSLRTTMAKYVYASKYNRNTLNDTYIKLDEICQKEEEMYYCLIHLLEEGYCAHLK